MSEQKPSYYSILPASVRYDKSLHPNAKILYTEITALCQRQGYCWASNNHFADLFDVSERSVINWLNNLKEKGYIKTKFIYKKDSKEIDHRRIYILDPIIARNLQIIDSEGDEKNFTAGGENSGEENFTTPHEKKFKTGGEENFTYNNKNLLINNSSSFPALEEAKIFAEEEELKIDVEKWWNHSKHGQLKNWKTAMIAWSKDSKNRVTKKILVTEDPTTQAIRQRIKKALLNDAIAETVYYIYDFDSGVIEGNTIFLKDKMALKYQDILAKINVKIKIR